ncbi:hypothetical protein EYF80_047993 [Liparis tanakae]|uniref:Uncharacterized protein n=1 Tax=Liparis tanakae TaxID=230148 RepID=A0A4Z2FL37_9TELE|nr:hypothetical protein EYF80_047993 [Liparis tanakae]
MRMNKKPLTCAGAGGQAALVEGLEEEPADAAARPTAEHAGDDVIEPQEGNAALGGQVSQDEAGLLHLSLSSTGGEVSVKCPGTWMWLGSRLKIFSVVELRTVQQLLGGLGSPMARARPSSRARHRARRCGRRASWNCCRPRVSRCTCSLSSATCFIHEPRLSSRWARVGYWRRDTSQPAFCLEQQQQRPPGTGHIVYLFISLDRNHSI